MTINTQNQSEVLVDNREISLFENSKTAGAVLFWTGLIISITLIVIIIFFIMDGFLREVIVMSVSLAAILIAMEFNRREKLHIAGSLIATTLILMVTALATIGQGIHDIGIVSYPSILIIASLMLRKRMTIILTSLMLLSVGWLVFGDIYNIYEPRYSPQESFHLKFVVVGSILVATAFVLHRLVNIVHKSALIRNKALDRRLQVEKVLGAVADTAMLLLRSREWRTEIHNIIRLLGKATGATHVYVYENHLEKDGIMYSSQKYEWTAPGMISDMDDPATQNFPIMRTKESSYWFDQLSSGKHFYGTRNEYPEFWESVITSSELKTLLEVPVFWNGEWQGIIGFDHYEDEAPWSQVEIDALIAAAGNLGTAIERQYADERLRASEEKFNLAFRHTYVAMAISQAKDNTLLDVNNSFCKVTGYSKLEAIGNRAGQDLNIWVNQEDRNSIIQQLNKQGFVDEYKAKFRRKNGDIGTGLLYAANVSIAGEACQLYSFIDISNIDQLLIELKEKNDELESFTYTVSHDLKSPLVTISGFMGYLEQDARNGDMEKLNNDILRINEAISKMRRLLNELLELSRIGRMMNPPDDVSFEEIVREALELVEGRLKAEHIQVSVETELPTVYGDRARLVQVIQNLVDNAAKFMKDQENPKIEIGVEQSDRDTVFFVRDNGAGIEPEYFERIFGLFNKLDTGNEGTGIGLALVKRIIEVHGGKIWVESDGLGKGSTFYFTLKNQSSNKVQNEK